MEINEKEFNEWLFNLEAMYRFFGIDTVKIVGEVLYPTPCDYHLGRGYDLRKMYVEMKSKS